MIQYSTSEIFEKLKAKDPEVFRYIYRTYGKMIVGHVMKNSGTQEDAKEMVQITLTELWAAINDGRYREEGKLGHYIYQLAANNWRYELRNRRNRPVDNLDDSPLQIADESEESMERHLTKDKHLNAIHQAMQHLDTTCAQIIKLYHLEEEGLQEIAQQMNYDYNNLRKRIFDCRKKLKKLTEDILSKASHITAHIL
jgi:RNA polymerase sigma factor (sigma-70 family)